MAGEGGLAMIVLSPPLCTKGRAVYPIAMDRPALSEAEVDYLAADF